MQEYLQFEQELRLYTVLTRIWILSGPMVWIGRDNPDPNCGLNLFKNFFMEKSFNKSQ